MCVFMFVQTLGARCDIETYSKATKPHLIRIQKEGEKISAREYYAASPHTGRSVIDMGRPPTP